MAAGVAISVKNVTKTFRVHSGKNTTLKEKLIYAGRGKYKDFVALRDVSLDVLKGSTVGLLGVNGSGKSTLLKLMSRILYPDIGSIEVSGRVSSLLELGAGFHPDFTGRENIFMNGALLGLTKREISEKLDEIIDFSELGDFIHEPVRNYSSGMYMRLAFSVAVAVDPEILLIDEILAVGDAAFQAKCMSRIRELKSRNKTIVIVTHDTGAVERLCDTAVWMNNSRIQMQGEPVDCIHQYIQTVFREARAGNSVMTYDRGQEEPRPEHQPTVANEDESKTSVPNETLDVEILSVRINESEDPEPIACGQPLNIQIKYCSKVPLTDVVFGVGIFSEDGIRCYGTNTLVDRLPNVYVEAGNAVCTLAVPRMLLLPGRYTIDVAIHKEDGEPYDYKRKIREFEVISDISDVGICRLEHNWTFSRWGGSEDETVF